MNLLLSIFLLIDICSAYIYIYIAGVASGATRAALTQHFALQSNAADISAKVERSTCDK